MESARELIGAARLSQVLLADLEKKRDRAEKDHRDTRWRIQRDLYGEQIRELERKRDEEIEALDGIHAAAMDAMREEAVSLCIPVRRLKRVLEFFRLQRFDLTVDLSELRSRKQYGPEPHKEDLGYLVDEEFMKVRLLILENQKPVNKYSLVAFGRCLFPNELLTVWKGYVDTYFYVFGLNLQIEQKVKDGSSLAELRAYAEKKRDGILPLKGDYDAVAAEYREIMASFTLDDFADVIDWQCECGHFWSVLDDVHYPDGRVPKCHKCEREMVKASAAALVN